MITILNPPMSEIDPYVIRRKSKTGEAYDSDVVKASGTFSRVSVKTGEDWNFIRLLQHGIDYHAPYNGDGLLVKTSLLSV